MEEVLNYIVQYGPGVVAAITVIVTGAVQLKRLNLSYSKFRNDRKVDLAAVMDQNSLLRKENDGLRDLLGEVRSENRELKKCLGELSAHVSHVEFIEK